MRTAFHFNQRTRKIANSVESEHPKATEEVFTYLHRFRHMYIYIRRTKKRKRKEETRSMCTACVPETLFLDVSEG